MVWAPCARDLERLIRKKKKRSLNIIFIMGARHSVSDFSQLGGNPSSDPRLCHAP
ncbi:hypothetical protein VCRA2119O54_1510001 [Vibrio crassostreae]|nr:hypothetical protein VCRA2119O44_1430001 [Vibrio crassostreae]CAK2130752.1 hypothetical protein VCRA2117O37_570002 [Vibrio crassostreae]CAK2209294.1 hypothetical protein VCRA2113O22_780002 [Vibrio crassostreae]CAK2414785.1 hypothetical protein VCRA2119O54_1510001 [Vibrio crassostreae]CAK3050455.1 hypothetical protein VCRA2120O59_560002 [Vibrio crassostreae]